MDKNRPSFTPYGEYRVVKDIQTNMQKIPAGDTVEVEGYWDEVTGGSWMHADGNPAAMVYAMRSAVLGLPLDNDVVYVKYQGYGSLIHISELEQDPA